MVSQKTYADVDIPDSAISQFVCERHAAYGDKPALIDGSTERVITYSELSADVQTIATGLRTLGVTRGDVVAVFGPNSPDYVAMFYGVTSTGAAITSLNVIHNAAELSYQLLDSGARILVLACEATSALAAAIRKTRIDLVVGLDRVRTAGAAAVEEPGPMICEAASDVASVTYTAAPSDVPMGVMVTHRNLVANLIQAQSVDPIGPDEVVVSLMPFCQLYGMVAVNLGLREGATVVTFPYFKLEWLLSAMQRHRVTSAYLVPPVIRTLAEHPTVGKIRPVVAGEDHLDDRAVARISGPRLCRSTAVQCPPGLWPHRGRCADALHAAALRQDRLSRHSGARNPVPGRRCRVAGERPRRRTGRSVDSWPTGDEGLSQQPGSDRDLVGADGWLRTCDIGYLDDEGYLFVVDRSKKLARLRGLHRHDGELLRAAIEDIAARLRSSDRLRVQSVLLNSVRESVLSTDLNNRVTFWNKGAVELFGYTAEEAMGRDVASLIVPDGVSFVDAGKAAALRARGSWSSQVMRRRKDGSMIWNPDVVVSIVTDAAGQRSGFLGIHRDVTEQRKGEERLRFQARAARQRTLESVVATDPEGRITFWAKGAERLFGYDAGEMLGESLAPLTFPEAPDPAGELARIAQEVIRTGSWTGRMVPCRRNGSAFWADVTFAPVVNADGARWGSSPSTAT